MSGILAKDARPKKATVLGWAVLLFALVLLSQIVALWPAATAATGSPPPPMPRSHMLWGLDDITFRPEVALLLMVLLVGAAGGLVELVRRFNADLPSSAHVAAEKDADDCSLRRSWDYAFLPVQGAGLAMIVYFVLRAGMLGVDQTAPLNTYGIAAISGFAGLFASQFIARLQGVATAFLGTPIEQPDTGSKTTVPGDRELAAR